MNNLLLLFTAVLPHLKLTLPFSTGKLKAETGGAIMIIEISIAVIAASFVLILIRLYTLSIRLEESIRRFEDFLSRLENDIRPILYDARNIVSDMRGILEIARHGTKKIDYFIEQVIGPFQTLGIIIKAIKAGLNTFFKRGIGTRKGHTERSEERG